MDDFVARSLRRVDTALAGPLNPPTPAHSFTSLLVHLATLTRNDIRYGTGPNTPTIPTLATPPTIQRRAFELIGCPIPIGLK